MDAPYPDDAFVYVDPEQRVVMGLVEWSKNGNAKPKYMPLPEHNEEGRGRGFSRRRRAYPWGSYKSVKRLYRLEGRVPEQRGAMELDRAIEKAAREAFWENEVVAIPHAPEEVDRP